MDMQDDVAMFGDYVVDADGDGRILDEIEIDMQQVTWKSM